MIGDLGLIEKLKIRLDKALLTLGYQIENQEVRPDLTVARISRNTPMAERMAAAKVLYSTPLVADLSFETNSLMLMRIVFRPRRVEYQPLKRIQLRSCHGDDAPT